MPAGTDRAARALAHGPATLPAVVRNGSWSVLAWAIGLLGGLPVTVASVRLMSHAAYGSLAVATTAVALLAAVASMGLTQGVAQLGGVELAIRGPAALAVTARAGLHLARAATLPALAAGIAIALLLQRTGSPEAAKAVLVMLPLLVVTPARAVLSGRLQALLRPRPQVLAEATSTVVTAIWTLSALAVGLRSAPAVAGAVAASSIVGALVIVRVGGRPAETLGAGNPVLTGSDNVVSSRRLLRVSASMLASGLSWSAIALLDVLIVGLVLGTRAAGFYAPLSAISMLTITAFGVVGTYLLSAMSRLVAGGTAGEANRLFYRTSQWGVVVAAPLVGAFLVAPGWPLRVLFGASFTGLDWPMRILEVAASVHVLSGYNGVALEAQGHAPAVALRATVGLSVDVIGCVVLVPAFGLLGAAVATLGAVCAVNLSCAATLWRRFRVAPLDRGLAWTVLGLVLALTAAAGLDGLLRPPSWLAALLAATLCAGAATAATIRTGARR